MYYHQEKSELNNDPKQKNLKAVGQRKNMNLEFQKELQLKEKAEKKANYDVGGSTIFQLKTTVTNKSIDQAYRSKGDVSQQRMGVEMESLLDPWNPLHGTESGAFTRHGLYLDDDYNEGDSGATAMHLLNAHLGGLAADENLFPSHTNKNGQHLKSGETEVKNKLLSLMKNDLDGYKVYYKVKFSPPSVLTPDNFTGVSLKLNHYYVDEDGDPVNDLMTEVSDDPNADLAEKDWVSSTSANLVRDGRRYKERDVSGERATFKENVKHSRDDENYDAVRSHIHIAHEDKDSLLS